MPKYSAMNTFSHNVKEIMANRGYSHQDMATMLNVPRTNFSRTLRGEHSPRLCFVEKVAEALEVSVQDLFRPIREKIPA